MYLSTLKRFFVIFALVIAIFTGGSLILSFVFHVENPWPWSALVSLLAAPVLYLKIFQLPYIKWKDSYYVGVEEIDYDHKQLVGLINQVVTASHTNLRENMVPEILDELIGYTKYHLDREEKLMEEYGYPEKTDHDLQHVKFINKINQFHSKFEKKREMKSEAVFDFLRGWLLKHISNTDKDLGAFIKAKRAKTA
jgi:hemerythrin